MESVWGLQLGCEIAERATGKLTLRERLCGHRISNPICTEPSCYPKERGMIERFDKPIHDYIEAHQ